MRIEEMKKGYVYKLKTHLSSNKPIYMEVLQISDNDNMLIVNTYNTHNYNIGTIGQWSGDGWKEKGSAFNLYLKLL